MPIVDPRAFRTILGHFCSGITIITAARQGIPVGFTCQSFFSVSLEPPLVAFAPARSSRTYPEIRAAGAFCINVLAEDQEGLCAQFARSGTDKWADVVWEKGETGSPILAGAVASIECLFHAEHEAGDHYLTLGAVAAMRAREANPLLYFRSGFARLAPA